MSKKNITAITLNTAFSMTDLSIYINGAGGTTQAFACYAVMDANTPQVLASQHAVTVAKNGSKTVPAISNVSGAVITYAVTTALTGVSVTNAGVISAGTTAGTAVITVTATYDTNKTVRLFLPKLSLSYLSESSGIVPPAGCSDAQQRLSARRFTQGEGR